MRINKTFTSLIGYPTLDTIVIQYNLHAASLTSGLASIHAASLINILTDIVRSAQLLTIKKGVYKKVDLFQLSKYYLLVEVMSLNLWTSRTE